MMMMKFQIALKAPSRLGLFSSWKNRSRMSIRTSVLFHLVFSFIGWGTLSANRFNRVIKVGLIREKINLSTRPLVNIVVKPSSRLGFLGEPVITIYGSSVLRLGYGSAGMNLNGHDVSVATGQCAQGITEWDIMVVLGYDSR